MKLATSAILIAIFGMLFGAAGHAGAAQTAGAGLLVPGDLVSFNTQRRAHSHLGIYIGDGRFVHSPRAGQQVRVEHMAAPYWARRFDGARRATGS